MDIQDKAAIRAAVAAAISAATESVDLGPASSILDAASKVAASSARAAAGDEIARRNCEANTSFAIVFADLLWPGCAGADLDFDRHFELLESAHVQTMEAFFKQDLAQRRAETR